MNGIKEEAVSWWRPRTIGQMVFSIRRRYAFNGMGLRGEYVAVCSPRPALDESHPLSDHIITGAARFHDDYMATGSREPHPSVVTYYVMNPKTGRAVIAVQADGTILDELDTELSSRPQRTRDAIREAITNSTY